MLLITIYNLKLNIMSDSNFPAATTTSSAPRSNYKNGIIAALAVALVGVGGYAVVDKNKTGEVIHQQETTIAKVSDEKSDIQKSFDGSLARLDSLGTVNTSLESKLKDKTSEIAKTKNQIRSILNKKNATAAELAKAKTLIADLNGKITGMQEEIAKLTQDNQNLTADKVALTADKEKLTTDLNTTTVIKQDLEKKVDVASTLNASNIAITAINVKKNGKEKITTTAKRVDKLVISFDVNNRIIQSGMTDVYVVVIGPDGKPISAEKLGSGTFTTREDGDKAFTAKLPVDLETSKKKNVEFAFAPGESFQKGSYIIQIYQNGFKIGEGTRELKKGGLFS
jgi:peptidoglycan hydrolase CwlO-like protein